MDSFSDLMRPGYLADLLLPHPCASSKGDPAGILDPVLRACMLDAAARAGQRAELRHRVWEQLRDPEQNAKLRSGSELRIDVACMQTSCVDAVAAELKELGFETRIVGGSLGIRCTPTLPG